MLRRTHPGDHLLLLALDLQLASRRHTRVASHVAGCPTCRIVFFRIDGKGEPYAVGSHLHSEDEIIHVLSGALQVGRHRIEPGMSVAIPANERYGFRTTGPFSFLNYRADASTYTLAPGTEPVLEGVSKVGGGGDH